MVCGCYAALAGVPTSGHAQVIAAWPASTSVPAMARSRVAPAVASLGLLAGALAAAVAQLAALPLLLLPAGRAWGWLLVPLTLLTTPLWSVLHEAIHGGLFADRRRNDRAGRLLAIAYGAPFALLKSGHLMHHR